MKKCLSSTFLCGSIIATLAIGFLPKMGNAQEGMKQYIPSSAMAALIVKPLDALAQPGMELVPYEILTAMGEKELGFDPCKITMAMALVESISDMERPPQFGLMVQFDSPQFLSEAALDRMDLTKTKMDGKTFYKSDWSEGPSVLRLDEKSMIVGNEDFIQKMMSATGAKSPLLSQMEQNPSNGHIDLYVSIEPVRGLIKQNLPPANRVPPPFARFLDLPDLIDSISMTNSLAIGGETKIQIDATSADAAKEIDEMIVEGATMAKQIILGQMAGEMQGEDPALQRAVTQYVNRIADYFQQHARPKIDDNHLVFDFSSEQSQHLSNVGTIGVLVGMLLPAVQQVREAARRTTAANTLRQFALAALNYESAYGHYPAAANYSEDGKPLLSWRVHVLPFIEQNNLYNQFNLDEPWDSPNNIKLLDKMPEIFRGPNSVHENKTVFLGISGPGTVFGGEKGTTLGSITDGTSNTMIFVEVRDDAAVEWTKPGDYDLDADDPLWGLVGNRPGGFNAAMCDGSVRFIQNSTPAEIIRRLMLKADGEVINDF